MKDRYYLFWLLPLFAFVVIGFSIAEAEPPAQVTLTWELSTSPDVVSYKIFKRPYTGAYDYTAPAWTGEGPPATLTAGAHYAYVCRAVDEAGNESIDSNEASTWDGAPEPPGGLSCKSE